MHEVMRTTAFASDKYKQQQQQQQQNIMFEAQHQIALHII